MTGTALRPFVDTLRNGLRWLKNFETVMDFSMDEYLLGRITALEQVVSGLEARIDGLTAERPPRPQEHARAPLAAITLDTH